MTTPNKPSIFFWIISALAFFWNLLGVFAYISQAYWTEEDIAKFTEAEQAFYHASPAWATAAFAIAVFAGAAGCLALLLRKKWATTLFIVSLLAVIAQQVYTYIISSDGLTLFGENQLVMPIFIVILAIFLVWYSRKAKANGWIS